jgi:hypothetical protein
MADLETSTDQEGSEEPEESDESFYSAQEEEPVNTTLPEETTILKKDYLGSRYEYQSKDTPAPKDINARPANPTRRTRGIANVVGTGEDMPGQTIPLTLPEAKKLTDWPLWEQAIIEELNSIRENGTEILVPKPAGKNVVKSKFVFDIKKDDVGNIIKYKVRNVARGFSQIEGVDYFDTSSPVIKSSSLKILLSIIAHEDLDMEQIDVKTAFLIPTLKREIYMQQVSGYEDVEYPDYVWKLNKAIYGLKQSGFEWNAEADTRKRELGFQPSTMDPCVYTRGIGKKRMLVGIYVDDGIIAGGSKKDRSNVITHLQKYLEVKQLGEPEVFVSITIKRERDRKRIHLSQPKQILSILEATGMMDCHAVDSPWQIGADLEENPEEDLVSTQQSELSNCCWKFDLSHDIKTGYRGPSLDVGKTSSGPWGKSVESSHKTAEISQGNYSRWDMGWVRVIFSGKFGKII